MCDDAMRRLAATEHIALERPFRSSIALRCKAVASTGSGRVAVSDFTSTRMSSNNWRTLCPLRNLPWRICTTAARMRSAVATALTIAGCISPASSARLDVATKSFALASKMTCVARQCRLLAHTSCEDLIPWRNAWFENASRVCRYIEGMPLHRNVR